MVMSYELCTPCYLVEMITATFLLIGVQKGTSNMITVVRLPTCCVQR